jgi:hypothetical protein
MAAVRMGSGSWGGLGGRGGPRPAGRRATASTAVYKPLLRHAVNVTPSRDASAFRSRCGSTSCGLEAGVIPWFLYRSVYSLVEPELRAKGAQHRLTSRADLAGR